MPLVKYLSLMTVMAILPYAWGQSLNDFEEEFIKIVKKVRPCVVKIKVNYKRRSHFRACSGIVFDNNGHIITIAGAVKNSRKIIVELEPAQKYPAKIVGLDLQTNLAVLKIAAKGLRGVKSGACDRLRVGAFLITIGNPYGLNNSVSTGIVSGLNRCVWLRGCRRPLTGLVQTTAPINPGDDGGLVVDSRGRFVGMAFSTLHREIYTTGNHEILRQVVGFLKELRRGHTPPKVLQSRIDELFRRIPQDPDHCPWAISSGNALISQGINFVLPSKTVLWVARQIIRDGKVHRGWVGITVKDHEKQMGVVVAEVVPGSPAAQSGITVGDHVIAVNGKTIRDSQALLHQIMHFLPRRTITLDFLRGGVKHQKKLTLRCSKE